MKHSMAFQISKILKNPKKLAKPIGHDGSRTFWGSILLLEAVIFVAWLPTITGSRVGVCYGMLGNDLPTPAEVVELYKQHKIDKMRLFQPKANALHALRDSEIELAVDVPWEDLEDIANSTDGASDWVQRNIIAYWPQVKFKYIGVGNEVIPSSYSRYVLPAMKNIYEAIAVLKLENAIKVSTVVHSKVLGISYPPSEGSFSSDSMQYMVPIVRFLSDTNAPLLCNVYPFFAYIGDPESIPLDYALFRSEGTVVRDGNLQYQNLFDAMVDSLYAALGKVDGSNVEVVISETGWPWNGGFGATIENAKTYNQNAINHVEKGTPRRKLPLETYFFAMFNENQKPGADTEKYFGLFYPNKKPVYSVEF